MPPMTQGHGATRAGARIGSAGPPSGAWSGKAALLLVLGSTTSCHSTESAMSALSIEPTVQMIIDRVIQALSPDIVFDANASVVLLEERIGAGLALCRSAPDRKACLAAVRQLLAEVCPNRVTIGCTRMAAQILSDTTRELLWLPIDER